MLDTLSRQCKKSLPALYPSSLPPVLSRVTSPGEPFSLLGVAFQASRRFANNAQELGPSKSTHPCN